MFTRQFLIVLFVFSLTLAQGNPELLDYVQPYGDISFDSSHFTGSEKICSTGVAKNIGWVVCRGFFVNDSATCDTCKLSINLWQSHPDDWIIVQIPKGYAVPWMARRIRLGNGTNIPIKQLRGIVRFPANK